MGEAAFGWGPRERALLEFERAWIGRTGGKADAIRTAFGISAARYYQLLNRTVERAEALDHDPLLVRRLRRRRDERERRRATGAPRRREQR